MENWKNVYEAWMSKEDLDLALKRQLEESNEEQLHEAFYKELTFGTGGMRGILGPGINRMNKYTIRKVVSGLADYLLVACVNVKDRGVVVAYDSRYMSKEFALETAKVLGMYGIKTYVFKTIHPTPLLSFAVRYLGTVAGVMITASHNPPEYNGFKVYNEDGGQMIPEEADAVIEKIQAIEDELSIPVMEQDELEAKDLLIWVGQEIDNAYLEQLQLITKLSEIDFKRNKDLSIVYTPLHGTGRDLVEQGLQQMNFKHVHIVEEQAVPDPAFSTVASPNPEEHQAFTLAIEAGEKQNADILLATDPDADRLGVAVKNRAGEYTILTGNQLGSLMVDYLLKHTEPILLQNARVLKSIVSTEFAKAIAEKYGVEVVNTLTGFKYIAEKIHHYDETGETFMFGFEESYGYLVQGFVRDKDAVQASIMACEMAYYWKQQGKTLLEALEELYEQHGYYMEGMSSLTLEGREGIEQISRIMETIRKQPLKKIAHLHVLEVEDYLTSIKRTIVDQSEEEIALPQENVLKFILEKDSWVCLRPSGTEPKIKCYYGVSSNSSKESEQSLLQLKQFMEKVMHDIIASDA